MAWTRFCTEKPGYNHLISSANHAACPYCGEANPDKPFLADKPQHQKSLRYLTAHLLFSPLDMLHLIFLSLLLLCLAGRPTKPGMNPWHAQGYPQRYSQTPALLSTVPVHNRMLALLFTVPVHNHLRHLYH